MVGITIKNERKFSKLLMKELDIVMDDLADFIFTASQENIVRRNIPDRGSLLQSGNVERKFLEKKIVYPVAHAASVEFGRMPGEWVPIEPLKGWVKRKLNAKENVAYAVRQKIFDEGIEPKHFLRDAVDMAVVKFGRNQGIR